MTKRQFLDELRARLSPLPQLDIEKTIAFYSEMIDDRIDDGMAEEEAVEKMESPAVIAERIIAESGYPPVVVTPQPQQKQKTKSDYRALWITLAIIGFPIWGSILISLLSAIFVVYISIWTVVISLFAVAIALAAASVGCIVAGAMSMSLSMFAGSFSVGAALICAGLSIIMFIVSIASAKGVAMFTAFLFRKLRSAFSRKKEA